MRGFIWVLVGEGNAHESGSPLRYSEHDEPSGDCDSLFGFNGGFYLIVFRLDPVLVGAVEV